MKLLNKTILSISCILFSNSIFAQELEKNIGSGGGNLNISMSVPSLCVLNTNNFADFDFGEYIGSAITRSTSLNINCKTSTNISFAIDLGSNPHSTKELRRMPKDGVIGDTSYFVGYKFTTASSLTSSPIGGFDEPLKLNLTSNTGYLNIYAHLLANQNNMVLGSYSDTLDAYFEYN